MVVPRFDSEETARTRRELSKVRILTLSGAGCGRNDS
jgi:hypothetical protein